MKYNLDSLGPFAFEEMIQALMQKQLGLGGIVFGTGKDGAREYIFEGEATLPFPNSETHWKGYWVIQAKFKMPHSSEKDNLKWIKKQFQAELKKFKDPNKKLKKPDNYIVISNIKLSGQADVGEIDKLIEFASGFKNFIPNIHFILYDDICSMLENNRDVATSYLSYILPGDILFELYNFFQKDEERLMKIILFYLQKEFKYDSFSKLEQSGRQTDDNIKIENVFIDLYSTESNIIDAELFQSQKMGIFPKIDKNGRTYLAQNEEEKRFVERIVALASDSQRKCNITNSRIISRQNKFVLIGSAGQGKSTLTQFLSQLYRAYFINTNIRNQTPKFINDFLINLEGRRIKVQKPDLFRIPFRIILSNYSEWITKRKKEGNPINIMSLIKSELENDGDKIEIDDIRNIFSKLSTLIIFDGLDEVPASSNRNTIVSEIDNFIEIDLQNQNSDTIIIITTRPQGFKDEFNNENFTHLKIVELSKSDCKEYLTTLVNLSENKPIKKEKDLNTLFRAIEKDSSSRLMRTPLDATIMATLVKRGGNPPEVKYNLYKDYYKTIFDREREKGVFELDKYKGAINSLHEYLGFKMQCNSEQRKDITKITRGNFIKEIKKYYSAQKFSEEDATEKTTVISKVLTDRLVMIAELTTDLDNSDNNIIGFPVAPIQEYFASLFLVHEQDTIVIKRIKHISSSSYWRNVLLFMIGYFQNEGRSYLNDHIYTECKQNNQLEVATVKVGAWLAVDILIENIFSEAPKYEDIFADELEAILSLSPSNKHDYLLRMPETIISKHLKRYLNKELDQNKRINQKLTAWKIIIQIPELCSDIITKYWPDHKDELDLLKYIIAQQKLNYTFFIDKAITRLKDLINSDKKILYKFDFIAILANTKKLKNEDKKIVIEYLYLNKNIYYNSIGLILKIANDQKIDDTNYQYSNLKDDNIYKSIRLSEGYSRRVISYKQYSKTNEELKVVFEKYGIEYLAKLLDFYLSPRKETLNEFFLSLVNIDETKFNDVKELQKNWILSILFDRIPNKKEIKKIFTLINSNEFGDEPQWEALEKDEFANATNSVIFNEIINKYSSQPNTSNDQEWKYFLESYHSFYKPLIESNKILLYPDLLNEFILSFIRTGLPFNDSSSQKIYSLSKDNYSVIRNIIEILSVKNDIIDFNNSDSSINLYKLLLNGLLTYIKNDEFINMLPENREMLFSQLSIAVDNHDFPFYEPNENVKELIINTFNNISDTESSLIRYMFLTFTSKLHLKYLEKINTFQLLNKKFLNDQNEISRLLLLYATEIKSDNNGDILEQLMQIYKVNNYISKYIIRLIEDEKFDLFENIVFLNDFYNLLIEIEPTNYILHSKFETLIGEKIESASSKFDLEDIKTVLKLDMN